RDLGARDLPDPQASVLSTVANFAASPLFAEAGPMPTDIAQGQIGDCYLLATLASLAQQEPTLIRQSITELGDGTYAIRFQRDGLPVYVRVDADLPTYSDVSPTPIYAKLGAQDSLWAALIEKAYAFFRTGAGTYQSLHAGWMSEVFAALGTVGQTIWRSAGVPTDLLALLRTELDAGAAITWATSTIPAGVPLVDAHAYSVETVTLDGDGVAVSVTLRNPWRTDGGGNEDDANDGLVTLRRDQIGQAFSAIMYARV
ncbi:MAG: calpain family cysteine protease, partial [Planctomycetota bacterium]|nr:calpain family cysteine protease [Planctomycetota bacterium]